MKKIFDLKKINRKEWLGKFLFLLPIVPCLFLFDLDYYVIAMILFVTVFVVVA